ncbi:hypothetical protein [Kushneria sp. TE3]
MPRHGETLQHKGRRRGIQGREREMFLEELEAGLEGYTCLE